MTSEIVESRRTRVIANSSNSSNESEEDAEFAQPRAKRRRLSYSDEDEEDGGSEIESQQTRSITFTAPSRIQSQVQNRHTTSQQDTTPVAHNPHILTTSDTFDSIGVAPWLTHSLSTLQVHNPTEIQRSCIPEILRGRDCIGGSRTGTGKTIAFAVPILQKWSEDPCGIYAVVLTPTRELAFQIHEQFTALGAPQGLKCALVTGGTEMRPQAQALLRRPHIVIATPGRLADHIAQSGEETVRGLRRTHVLVLDEADRLLSASAGMLDDISSCLSALPPSSSRLTLLFTATVTPEVRALKDQPRPAHKPPLFLSEIADQSTAAALPPKLRQTYLVVPQTHKDAYLYILLIHLLTTTSTQIIVFTNRTSTTDQLHRTLSKLFALSHKSLDPDHAATAHLPPTIVTSLSSALPQLQRTQNLTAFRSHAARVLVCTDLASRGLDIPSVSHVINYDVPRLSADYVHRVGRTARANRAGTSVTFVSPRDVELVLAIETATDTKMEKWSAENGEEVNVETRVVRGRVLKDVGESRMKGMREAEAGKDVRGYRSKMKKRR